MLVLSRKIDESIMIGDDVELVIVAVRGDKVRLGITAPKSISVHRREIYDAVQRGGTDRKAPQAKSEEIGGAQETHADTTETPTRKQQ